MVCAYGGCFNFEEEMKDCFGCLSMLNTAIANYKAIALRTRLVTSSTIRL